MVHTAPPGAALLDVGFLLPHPGTLVRGNLETGSRKATSNRPCRAIGISLAGMRCMP
ncbi:unnamed protein product [Effrenium voratum]|uniref:Uncharacterized protein n=1 Tax=Effrenium voratum TaxID=2562239 RepID=A0AA36MKT4_9DINO|nr:unnamed protein product [Effrenium voratum]